MRWRQALAISFSAVILAAACAQTGTPGTSAGPSAGGSAAASGGAAFKRGDGGQLNILYWQAPTILNPHQATGTKDSDASRLVVEPLASWGADAKPVANAIAAEIPTVANGGVSAEFFAQPEVGDVVHAQSEYVDISERAGRSGPMVIVAIRTSYTTQHGRLLCRVTNSFIRR